MQASDIIQNAMRWLGALAVGETASTQELADGLIVLNELLGTLSAEEIYLYTRVSDSLTCAATTATYTWGSGGTLNTARPLRLLTADCSYQAVSQPVDIVSFAQWSGLREKSVQGNLVQKLYLDNAYPLSTISLWPVPKTTGTSLNLYSLKALSQFAAVTDTFDLPPGYERCIRLNLALDLAPEYGRPITEVQATLAAQSKQALKALNRQNYGGLDGLQSPISSDSTPAPAAPQQGQAQ